MDRTQVGRIDRHTETIFVSFFSFGDNEKAHNEKHDKSMF